MGPVGAASADRAPSVFSPCPRGPMFARPMCSPWLAHFPTFDFPVASSTRGVPSHPSFVPIASFQMKKTTLLLLLVSSILIAGCGGSETVIPKDALTEEQKAAIKAEDKSVADEESGKAR